jgi:osmoprotectant transport system substrate-binding protein
VQPEVVLLADDKQVWPPYNIAPVALATALDAYPEIADKLNEISQNLTTELVTELNAKVDIDGEEYADVAKEYYESLSSS